MTVRSLDVTARATAGGWPTGSGISTRGCLPNCWPRWPVLRHRRHGPAYIGPERNNHGHAVLSNSIEIYPTRRIYAGAHRPGPRRRDATPRLAHHPAVQADLVDGLKALLRAGRSGIPLDIGTISEATTYVYDKSGSMNARTAALRRPARELHDCPKRCVPDAGSHRQT